MPGADFMPASGGPLVDVGSAVAGTSDDFDLSARPAGAGPDVGAYELHPDLSDHWPIALDFKGAAATGGFGGEPNIGGSGAGVPTGASGQGAAGADATGGAPGEETSGCGCRVEAAGRGAAATPLGLGVAGLLVLRRRARRRQRR